MLSRALRLIRVFHDLKQVELAARLGISKSHLSELESGRKTPTMEIIEKYAHEFKIPPSSILFFSEQLPNDPNDKVHVKVRGAIAQKVLNFLQFVAEHTDGNEKEVA